MTFNWHALKDPIVDASGLSQEMLHLAFGLVIFLIAAWSFSNRPRQLLYAWSTVLTLEMLNETADAIDFWNTWIVSAYVMGTTKDVVATMALPTLAVALIWASKIARGANHHRFVAWRRN